MIAAVNTPNPALVTQRAVRRLPRLALLLFCAAYVLPGLFGRDPWNNADITAFGYMLEHRRRAAAPGWRRSLGGVPADAALLPYWLGAVVHQAAVALARPGPGRAHSLRAAAGAGAGADLVRHLPPGPHRSAQPVAFAFGGEAEPVDYARAIADGARAGADRHAWACCSSATKPRRNWRSSFGVSLFLWCAGRQRPTAPGDARARGAGGAGLLLAGSGAPMHGAGRWAWPARWCCAALELSAGARAGALGWLRRGAAGRCAAGLAAGRLGAGASAARFDARPAAGRSAACWLWFTVAGLAAGAVDTVALAPPAVSTATWRCRCGGAAWHWSPASPWAAPTARCCWACPALAVLAAFALPTLKRSTAAAIDWFSLIFFTLCAGRDLGHLVSVQTGVPAKPAANVAAWRPASRPVFAAGAGRWRWPATLAWVWLVRWRTGRHRAAAVEEPGAAGRRRGPVLAAADDAGLPMLDYARSNRPLVERMSRHVPARECIAAPGQPRALIAALEYFGPLSSRCARRRGTDTLQLPAQGGAGRTRRPRRPKAGHASRASAGPPTATT